MKGSVMDFGDDAYLQWACPVDSKTTFVSSGTRGQLLETRVFRSFDVFSLAITKVCQEARNDEASRQTEAMVLY